MTSQDSLRDCVYHTPKSPVKRDTITLCMNDRKILLTAHGLGKTYSMGKIRVTALHEVDILAENGISLGVTGSSGSGKSNLLNLLGGLDTPVAEAGKKS